jgi:hypothetical protein
LDKISWDDLEKLAAIGYTPEKVAMFFDVPKIEFMYYFMLEDSKLKHHYDRGVLYYHAKEGLSMLEDADQNATQAQRLDKLRKTVKFRNAVDEILYGGI